MIRILLFFLLAMVSVSCQQKETDDPLQAYKYWAGSNPPEEIQILNGRYWESAHWTKEYIMYLKISPTPEWWDAFVAMNQLTIDHAGYILPEDAPAWFDVRRDFVVYSRKGVFDQGSRYFLDPISGICYLYEVQL